MGAFLRIVMLQLSADSTGDGWSVGRHWRESGPDGFSMVVGVMGDSVNATYTPILVFHFR
jgi:hypothetical protein